MEMTQDSSNSIQRRIQENWLTSAASNPLGGLFPHDELSRNMWLCLLGSVFRPAFHKIWDGGSFCISFLKSLQLQPDCSALNSFYYGNESFFSIFK